MGRLDDAAKYKVVELRKAGLSFRKIKAVLELENIKVSAQAIYLYLREFQGRPPGRVRPAEAGGSTLVAQVTPRSGALHESWSNNRLQNRMHEPPHHSGFATASGFPKQSSTNSETSGNASSSVESSGSSRLEQQQQHGENKEENDIQIVSVTSLAQQEKGVLHAGKTVEASASSTSTASNVLMRRRVTPSPATSSILAARRRLLDKALSHKTKVLSLLRKEPSSVQSSDPKGALSQLPDTYDLTTEKTVINGQLGGDGSSRSFTTQRPGLSLRSFQLPPRVGIRLPNRPQPPLTSSAPRPSLVHLQTPGSQGPTCREGNPSPQQAVQDAGGRSGLQDQIQILGTEVRSLGLAVKMLVEQQCRLEREQLQQTQIQKQILGTLQSFASKIGHCSSGRQQLNKTPSPSSLPAASGPSSFSQDSFSFSQGTYNQCSQTQPSYKSLESLQNVEALRLSALSPTNMNGFPSCSNAESHSLSHSTPQTQPYPAAYTQQSSQTLVPPYAESYIASYSKSHPQNFKTPEGKTSDFTSSCSRIFQDCSLSTQRGMNASLSAQDQQINSIKVEGP